MVSEGIPSGIKDLNFSKILFLHINRILMSSGGADTNAYISYIESFDDMLTELYDESTEDKLQKVLDDYNNVTGHDITSGDEVEQAKLTLAREKFRIIIGFIDDKGWLMERVATGYDIDEVGEGYETH